MWKSKSRRRLDLVNAYVNLLELVKQKGFFPYEYTSNIKKFKEQLPSKEKFYSSLTSRKISDKEYEHFMNVWNNFEMKTRKDL